MWLMKIQRSTWRDCGLLLPYNSLYQKVQGGLKQLKVALFTEDFKLTRQLANPMRRIFARLAAEKSVVMVSWRSSVIPASMIAISRWRARVSWGWVPRPLQTGKVVSSLPQLPASLSYPASFWCCSRYRSQSCLFVWYWKYRPHCDSTQKIVSNNEVSQLNQRNVSFWRPWVDYPWDWAYGWAY